jgi:hypothetical protein
MRGIAERAKGREVPRVACLEWIEPLMAAGNWTPELIALAGAQDVLGEPGQHAGALAFERLIAADPDVIWITPCGFDLARTRAELEPLVTHPGWSELRAVREGRVFLGDGNALFNRPGPRVVEALECLAEAMHPERTGSATRARAGSAGGRRPRNPAWNRVASSAERVPWRLTRRASAACDVGDGSATVARCAPTPVPRRTR